MNETLGERSDAAAAKVKSASSLRHVKKSRHPSV